MDSRWMPFRHLNFRCALLTLLMALPATLVGSAPGQGDAAEVSHPTPLPPLSERIAIRERWLEKRQDLVLDLMRRHRIGMWIIVNEEFHPDPLTEFVAPPRPYAGRRDFFVFIDGGNQGLVKVAVTGFASEAVRRFFEAPTDPRPAKEALPELIERYRPQAIALSTGGHRGVSSSLTRDAYDFLAETLGDEARSRFVPDEPLLVDYLNIRLPDEFEPYRNMVLWTEALVHRAFSREVITPGQTTVGEVRRWLYDQTDAMGATNWFEPDLRVQRPGMAPVMSRGFLAVAPESTVIQPGDLIHVDFGITAFGLNTDYQKMAYVLRPGETRAPEELSAALHHTIALQDAVIRHSRPGKEVAKIYTESMADMKSAGITAQIYSHPLGNQGHGLGASIDFRSAKKDADTTPRGVDARLRAGSWLALELNTRTPTPEWNGADVYMMEEDPVYLTPEGWKFFRPRQTALILIASD